MNSKLLKVLLLLLAMLTVLPLCACDKQEKQETNNLRIGMVTGGVFDQYVPDAFPGAEIQYYYSVSDLPLALQSGKIDVYLDDELSAKQQCKQYTTQRIDRVIHNESYGFIFNKNNEALRNQMNEFLDNIKIDGRLSEIENIWLYSNDESKKVIDYKQLTGENGTLKIGLAATIAPIDYIKDGSIVGLEPAIIKEFCEEYGYNIEIQNSNFSSIMSAITTGAIDIGCASYTINEERQKDMLFSNPYMSANCVAVVNIDDNSFSSNENKIGVVTGALFDVAVLNDNPYAQVEYYNYTSDLPIALDSAKIDGYTVDEPVAKLLCNIHTNHYIEKQLTEENYGIVISKKRKDLQDKFNIYLNKIKENGELVKLQNIWLGTNEELKTIDFDSIANNSDVLVLATTSGMEPFDYIKDGKYSGYEIALVAGFCKEYGYGLQIEDSNFTGVLSSVTTGKADFGSCVITITDERKQTLNFTDTIYSGGIVLVRKKNSTESLDPFDTLKGKKIGIQSGSSYDQYIYENIKDAEVEYFNMVSDMSAALDSNKISAFVVDGPVGDLFINENPGKYNILGNLHEIHYGIALPKNRENNAKLYKEINSFISSLRQDGSLEKIYNTWIGTDDSNKVVDLRDLTDENGVITLAVSSETGAPFIYLENGNIYGFEIDLIHRFCKEYGYGLNIDDYNLTGAYTAITTGKCDVGVGGISIIDERKETMLFVDEQITGSCVLIAKNNNIDANVQSSNRGIFDSFYRTFIREERYKLFISGILTTILITALSIIFGTIFGFSVYMLYRGCGEHVKVVIDAIRNIILKTPTVVILMILYYILFSKLEISGIAVSIVGLSVLFANSVIGLIAMGTNAIDKGQMEAALALGFSRPKAYVEIIIPQVILNVASGYKSAVISLIKESAIVGYIAVQDLTKVGDIIRSRTYEAFFPLISTAFIYYLIATVFIYFANKFEIKIDPKKRTTIKILKGVTLDDRD